MQFRLDRIEFLSYIFVIYNYDGQRQEIFL